MIRALLGQLPDTVEAVDLGESVVDLWLLPRLGKALARLPALTTVVIYVSDSSGVTEAEAKMQVLLAFGGWVGVEGHKLTVDMHECSFAATEPWVVCE